MSQLLLILAAALVPGQSVPIDAALLAGLPVSSVSFEDHGKKSLCEGPSLAAVLGKLGAPSGEKLRGPLLALTVTVRAKDGYEVAFSLGELDASLGGETVIIATRCDGQDLAPGIGPYRVVVPGDKRPARAVRMAASITLK